MKRPNIAFVVITSVVKLREKSSGRRMSPTQPHRLRPCWLAWDLGMLWSIPRTRHRTVCASRCVPSSRQTASLPSPLQRSEMRIQCGPHILNLKDGVTSRRPAACAARLEQTASLPCAAQHTLRAFWTSCRVRGIDQSIPRLPNHPDRASGRPILRSRSGNVQCLAAN